MTVVLTVDFVIGLLIVALAIYYGEKDDEALRRWNRLSQKQKRAEMKKLDIF
jgi:hypothetical protein